MRAVGHSSVMVDILHDAIVNISLFRATFFRKKKKLLPDSFTKGF
jgi:hypothetical protein